MAKARLLASRPRPSTSRRSVASSPRRLCGANRTALLPHSRPRQPKLGGHNPRVDSDQTRPWTPSSSVLLHRMPVGSLCDATIRICKHWSARHRRFSSEWAAAGVFVTLWAQGLEEYDQIKWARLGVAGAIGTEP